MQSLQNRNSPGGSFRRGLAEVNKGPKTSIRSASAYIGAVVRLFAQ